MNKKGAIGESVITLYRIMVIIIISVAVLGVSSVVYSHHISVIDSEAMIMGREISDCVINDGAINLDELKGKDNLFGYCGFDEDEVERFFVVVSVIVKKTEVFRIEGGDSGLLWVKDVYNYKAGTEAIDKYEPGHFERVYRAAVLDGSSDRDGLVAVEVVTNVE
jgi:hypothetical protein